MFGHLVSRRTLNETAHNWFDPFGRVYYYVVEHPLTNDYLYDRWSEFDDSGNEVYYDAYYGDLFITGSKVFDAFSRETARTDADGNTVTTAYDAFGRPVAADGATYPTLKFYDTAGRMTSLSTTRDASAWDTTQWLYDRATGLATNKIYADGNGPGYAYTTDGKPLRTIWARGAWKENAYTVDGLLSAVDYSDTTPAISLAYDAHQYLVAASNAVAQFAYLNSALGTVTNESAVVGTNAFTLTRQLDSLHRLARLSLDGHLHAAYTYDAESRFSVVSNDAFSASYAYANDGWDTGYIVSLTNGTVLFRTVSRDPYRRSLVTGVSNAVAGAVVSDLHYGYDILGRVVSRNGDAFDCNTRSEVTSATIQLSHTTCYEYDGIGNNRWTTVNGATNACTANALNQYTSILSASAPPREIFPIYDLDGNLLTNDVWSYTWDAENRLAAVYSNSTLAVSNAYDHQSRRVLKITPTATHTFIYDGWNLVQDIIATVSSTSTNTYVWGKDISGAMQGAGGVSGLLAAFLNGAWYFPFYDNNGNITAYAAESGVIVAEYIYDAFGRTIAQSGPMANAFPHRFSAKYYDTDVGLYYYGLRFYSSDLHRWLNRDLIGEDGGLHLYGFVDNNPVNWVDAFGDKRLGKWIEPGEKEGWSIVGTGSYPGPGWSGEFKGRPATLFDLAAKMHDLHYSLNDIHFGFVSGTLGHVVPFVRGKGKALSRKAKADYIFSKMNEVGTGGGNWVGVVNWAARSVFYDKPKYFRKGDDFENALLQPETPRLSNPKEYLMIPYSHLKNPPTYQVVKHWHGLPDHPFTKTFSFPNYMMDADEDLSLG